MKKSKKICRKKHPEELEINEEYLKQINELATQFKENKLKNILRRCYNDVQKYGPKAIMKVIEDSWTAMAAVGCQGMVHSSSLDENAFIEMEEKISKEHMDENLEVNSHWADSTQHDHKETSKRNALFLIESSERLDDYDSETLTGMKRAYEKGSYEDVADLAYLQDRSRRPAPQPPESRVDDNTTLHREAPKSPWSRVSELLEEVVDDQKETPLKHCVDAVRHLSGDLTYDDRNAAKNSIRKAIGCIEDEDV